MSFAIFFCLALLGSRGLTVGTAFALIVCLKGLDVKRPGGFTMDNLMQLPQNTPVDDMLVHQKKAPNLDIIG